MGQVLTIEPDKAYQVIQKAAKLHVAIMCAIADDKATG